MRFPLKRLLPLLLAGALLAGALALPAAAEAKPAPKASNPNGCRPGHTCKYSPVIIVPGIGQSNSVLYVDGEPTGLRGSTVIPDLDAIEPMDYVKVVFSLLASLVLQSDIFLTKNLYDVACKLFWPQKVGLDGKPVEDLRTEEIGCVADMDAGQKHTALDVNVPAYGVIDTAGEDHLFFFAFNLAGDVWDNIDELEKYIDYVRKRTGHDKVCLADVSLGGTLFTGYLEKYGWKKLDQVINVVGTMDGTPLMADLFTFTTKQDDTFWYRDWLPTMIQRDIHIADGYDRAIGYLIGLAFRLLPYKVISGMFRSVWQGALDTMILNGTQFWAMIPKDRYPQARKMWLEGNPDRAKVMKLTDAYYQAQLNLEKNVKAAVKDGVHINNISGSGLTFGEGEYTFFQPAATQVNSDGIVWVAGATMGATCALPGQKLPASYKPKVKGYLSPDGSIDCSTCVLPDNAWVFLDQPHEVGRNDAVLNLVTALYRNPGMTVKSDPKNYPQYNPSMNTNDLRRGCISDAEKLLADAKAGSIEVSAADQAALKAAIKEGKAVRALTVGDPARANAATEKINALLTKYGRRGLPYEQTKEQKALEDLLASMSQYSLYWYGGRGFEYSRGPSLIGFWKRVLAS